MIKRGLADFQAPKGAKIGDIQIRIKDEFYKDLLDLTNKYIELLSKWEW